MITILSFAILVLIILIIAGIIEKLANYEKCSIIKRKKAIRIK